MKKGISGEEKAQEKKRLWKKGGSEKEEPHEKKEASDN